MVKREIKEIAEMMFVQLTTGKSKITVGVVYAPQENKTKIKEVNKMYEMIEEEVKKAKQDNQVVLLVGDFKGDLP